MEREFWHHIIENRYALPDNHSLVDLTIELLEYLASPDPELRDTFAYDILARWIILYGYYDPDELRAMIEWLVPRLAEGLGEQNSDSVFVRSYAALILSLIIYRDNQTSFLSAAEVRSVLNHARYYFVTEQDLRAYVPGKGWANACGHTADLLKFLARSSLLEAQDLMRLLDAIADRLTTGSSCVIFSHDEDDRLAQAALSAIRRDSLTMYELTDWLSRFHDWKASQPKTSSEYNAAYHATYQNIRNFVRSLYAYMQLSPHLNSEADDLLPELLATIRVFSL